MEYNGNLAMKLALFIIIVLVLEGLMFGGTAWETTFASPDTSTPAEPTAEETEAGGWNPLGFGFYNWFVETTTDAATSAWDTILTLWNFILFLWLMLTFDIAEIPAVVRILIMVPMWMGIIYIISPLLIGLVRAVGNLIPFT